MVEVKICEVCKTAKNVTEFRKPGICIKKNRCTECALQALRVYNKAYRKTYRSEGSFKSVLSSREVSTEETRITIKDIARKLLREYDRQNFVDRLERAIVREYNIPLEALSEDSRERSITEARSLMIYFLGKHRRFLPQHMRGDNKSSTYKYISAMYNRGVNAYNTALTLYNKYSASDRYFKQRADSVEKEALGGLLLNNY